MRQRLPVLMISMLLVTLACGSGVPAAGSSQPNMSTIVASTLQAYTQAASKGTSISLQNVSFIIPEGLAGGATSRIVPAVSAEQAGAYLASPQYIQFNLNDYASPGSFSVIQINIYPAPEYAKVNPYASQCLDRLQAMLAGKSPTFEYFPGIPFFLGGGPMFLAQTKLLDFNSGRGVRAISEYGENVGQVTNQGVFYSFQGLTSDGKFYIVAVLNRRTRYPFRRTRT
jgi:hypothetical protein